jgi:hypothetical protein
MIGRIAHQYSNTKVPTLEKAVDYFLKCQKALPRPIAYPKGHEIVEPPFSLQPSPQKSIAGATEQSPSVDATPSKDKGKGKARLETAEERNGELDCGLNGVAESLSKILQLTIEAPFARGDDPFVSPETPVKKSVDDARFEAQETSNDALPSVSKPSPLRIRKMESKTSLQTTRGTALQSPMSPMTASSNNGAGSLKMLANTAKTMETAHCPEKEKKDNNEDETILALLKELADVKGREKTKLDKIKQKEQELAAKGGRSKKMKKHLKNLGVDFGEMNLSDATMEKIAELEAKSKEVDRHENEDGENLESKIASVKKDLTSRSDSTQNDTLESRDARIEEKKESWKKAIDKKVADDMTARVETPENREAKREALRAAIRAKAAARTGKPINPNACKPSKSTASATAATPNSASTPKTDAGESSKAAGKKKSNKKKRAKNPSSDRESIKSLEKAWENSGYEGTRQKHSDYDSLKTLEGAWDKMNAEERAARQAEEAHIASLCVHIRRYNKHLADFTRFLGANVEEVRGLAVAFAELQENRRRERKLVPSKSFWSFETKGLGSNEEDGYDEHRDGEKMKKNLAFAMPGSVLNETLKERIARLKADNWTTVGPRNPTRGWKGSEYYENFCNEVLADLDATMRGLY